MARMACLLLSIKSESTNYISKQVTKQKSKNSGSISLTRMLNLAFILINKGLNNDKKVTTRP